MEKKLTMGTRFNSHFGYLDLPSEIIEVGIFENHIEFDCMDGIYHVHKYDKATPLIIKKVFSK